LCIDRAATEKVVALQRESPRSAPPAGPFQYGLSSLFLIVTLGVILGSVFVMQPGLGIVAAILATPALLWTIVAAMRQGRRGEPMSPERRVSTFILALSTIVGGIIVTGGAFFIAMMGTCLVVVTDPFHDASMVLPQVIGGCVAVAVAGVFVWVVWKYLHRKPGDRKTDSIAGKRPPRQQRD
jgi:hypothetical protein